jgi:hypothetical protein
MAAPDLQRRPPSRRLPPRPPRSRRWILGGVLAIVAIALPTVLLLAKRQEWVPTREEPAESFVRGLALANGVESGPAGRTGFAAAYAQLSERRKEDMPFDVFLEDWSRLLDAKGFVVDYVRTSEPHPVRRNRADGDVSFLLFLGGEKQDHASLETVELKLAMKFNWKNGTFEVSDYSRNHVPNPRATR